jgi:hypothetical protein
MEQKHGLPKPTLKATLLMPSLARNEVHAVKARQPQGAVNSRSGRSRAQSDPMTLDRNACAESGNAPPRRPMPS